MVRSPIQVALTEMLLLYVCANMTESPTRVNESSATIIDLCYTNFLRYTVFFLVFSSGLRDHLPLFEFFLSVKNWITPIYSRRTTYINNIAIFYELMTTTNWAEVYSASDTNEAYNNFITEVINHYNVAFPVVAIRKHRKDRKGWITKALFVRIEHKKTSCSLIFTKQEVPRC